MSRHCSHLSYPIHPIVPFACSLCPVQIITSRCGGKRYVEKMCGRKSLKKDSQMLKCWLVANEYLIERLAQRLHRSTEIIRNMLIEMLIANYKSRKHSTKCIILGNSFADLCGLFHKDGYLVNPFAPGTLIKVIKLMREYIGRKRGNQKLQWNQFDCNCTDVFKMLGENDVLVQFLRKNCPKEDMSLLRNLLQAIDVMSLEPEHIIQNVYQYVNISKLYNKVAAEVPNKDEVLPPQKTCLPLLSPMRKKLCVKGKNGHD